MTIIRLDSLLIALKAYQYNRKELQDALNLAWIDYGAWMYQSEIGKWTAIDFMSEKYNYHSPYRYVLNNPVALVDPDGNDVYLVVWFTAKVIFAT